ncbi:PAS domain S-box protein [Halorubellus litoreus]|uniref:histidine kinase n=1 Tax=Halorubellus litoreus TaxID=755308 RepID=A0ABD5VDF4_9EURY
MAGWRDATTDAVRVLHVDDDEQLLDLTATSLERVDDDFEVTTAVGAPAGLDVLDDAHVDCIVSDYQMPAMDGLEFLERVRETHPELPFVLFTGEGSETVASDAIAAGATDYVPKGGGSDRFEVLANRVRNAVDAMRAEREVERTAARFQRVCDTAPVPIGIVDDALRVRYANDACVEFFAADDETDLLGESAAALVHPADRDRAAERVRAVLEERETPNAVETRFLTENDDSKYGVVTSAPVEYEGRPAAQVVIDDVTAERTATEHHEVVRRDGFTRSLLEALDGVFFVFQVDDGLVEWNDSMEAVTGYDADALAGASPGKFVPPEYHDRVEEDVRTVRDGGSVRYDGELLTADGERIPYEMHVASYEDADGRQFGVGFGQEITERVTREKRVRERKEQLETIVQHFPVVAFTVDADGVFTRSVGAGLDGLGIEPGELVGESIYDVYGEHEAVLENYESALAGSSAESTITVGDVTFETRYEPVLEDGDVSQVVGVAFDVTDRVEHREALEAKNERLEEFASVLSHDLRNPLSLASGTVEVLAEHVDADGREHLDTIRTAHDRMERIVDDVLALARGGSDVETAPVSSASVVDLAVETVDTEDVEVTVDYDAVVEANEGSFVRLVENLVRNAVEHGGERVVVAGLRDDDGFYVADDGAGLDEAVEASLFQPGVTTDGNGTGLGLAIVSDIADAHDWTVDVREDSDLGGARFEVRGVESA